MRVRPPHASPSSARVGGRNSGPLRHARRKKHSVDKASTSPSASEKRPVYGDPMASRDQSSTKDQQVTAADIARLAGVTRAAVSNWRRRHDDFPSPVGGTSSSPLFALDQVREWLEG